MDSRWHVRERVTRYCSKKKARRSFLGVAFLLVLTSILLMFPIHQTAKAAGASLAITPVSAVYSDKNAIAVQGANYAPSESVIIYWNYTGPGTGTPETTATADVSGAFKTTFAIPLAATGTYTIVGVGQTSGTVASGTFLLLPQLYVGPHPYTKGATLHIDGNAFSAGETVNMYWNYKGAGTGVLLGTTSGNATGSFLAYAFVPAGTTPGSYIVAGVGQTSNAVATFTYVIPQPAVTLTITPTSGAYSLWNQITVQGNNFAAGETVNIYWNYSGPGTGTLETTATADSSGTFSTSINRPLAPTGLYTIAGVGQTSGSVATGTFKLLPQIYGGPLDTGPGTAIHFNGNAFGAGESVNIYWNYNGPGTGTLLTTTTSNAIGSFLVYATVPMASNPGFNTVAGVGQTSNAVGTAQLFVYPPTLTLAPLSGAAGTVLTFSAYGFTAYENVAVYWNNGTTPFTTIKTDIYGHIPITTFTIPGGSSPAAYQVKAVGATSHVTMSNTFTVVTASTSLSVPAGPVGQSIHVTGQGYAPDENIALLWNYTGPGTGVTIANVNAGISGAFSTTVTVPASLTGTYTIAAVGAKSTITTQNTFTVANGLATNVTIISPGNNVAVSGTGFQAGESVQLYWDSTGGISLATSTADPNGNISQPVTIPATATYGSHQVIAVGQVSQQSYTAPVTIDTSWADFGFDSAHNHQNAAENTLSAANIANLKLKWTATTNINVKNSGCGATANVSSPLYANGIVYYATDDGYLNAYDAATGTVKWQFHSDTTFPNCSSPLLDPATGMVFFGTVGYNGAGVPTPFYALNAQTGALLWSIVFPWNEYSFPTVASHTLFIGMSREGYNESLYAIDEITGHVNWIQPAPGGVWGEVVTDPNTNTIFTTVGNPTPSIEALNATTGALIWQYNPQTFSGNDDVGAPLTLANGFIYASSKSGIIYALNEHTGAVAWSTSIGVPSNQDMSAPAVTTNGVVYVGSVDGFLYALNATTGNVLWKFATKGPVYSSPAVANGVVYFASVDHFFYMLDASTGSLLRSYLLGGQSYASPIVVNGWVYCGASDGKLYAFSL